jgi:hypothetical protein
MVFQAFHLSTQADNRTNVKIGKLTSKIAKETQRDSSSIITIAAVTMFFLPGTFISVSPFSPTSTCSTNPGGSLQAISSMVFFNTTTTPDGRQILQVSDK